MTVLVWPLSFWPFSTIKIWNFCKKMKNTLPLRSAKTGFFSSTGQVQESGNVQLACCLCRSLEFSKIARILGFFFFFFNFGFSRYYCYVGTRRLLLSQVLGSIPPTVCDIPNSSPVQVSIGLNYLVVGACSQSVKIMIY